MSAHWRCCCDDYPAGPKCYALSFAPKFIRWYTVTLTASSCESGCGTSDAVTASVALGALQAFGTQQVLLPRTPTEPCDCNWLCSIVDYTPDATWTAAVEFCSADCGEGTGAPGAWRIVSSTNLVSVVSVATAACGPPGFTGIQINFRGKPPAVTLSGCGHSVVMDTTFGAAYSPQTDVSLVYCRRPGTDSCVLDLYSVTMGGNAYSYNPLGAGAVGDCDCDPGTLTGNVSETVSGTIGTTTEYAGAFGSVYALAGSPPLSITCRACA